MTDQDMWVIVAWYGGEDDVEVIGPFERKHHALDWLKMHEVKEPHVVVPISDPVMTSTVWEKPTG